MKVYVVTTGVYSDYCIDSIFTDKEKAEEYAEWLSDSNGVEEYELDKIKDYSKCFVIRAYLKKHDNGTEDISVNVSKDINLSDYRYNYYTDYHKYAGNYIVINITRYFSAENFNEDLQRKRTEKTLYDLLAKVEYLRYQGYDEVQINKLLNEK